MKCRLFILCITVFAFFSCVRKATENYPAHDVSLTLTSQSGPKANLLVRHDGGNELPYYVFCGMAEAPLTNQQLMDKAQEDLTAGGRLLYGKNRVVSLEDLNEGAAYSALIVFTDQDAAILRDSPFARVDFITGADISINLNLVGKDKTSLTVNVESESDVRWCAFVTDDLAEDPLTLANRFLSDEDNPAELFSGTQTLTFDDLQPGWKYRVIAARLSTSGNKCLSYNQQTWRTDFDLVFTDKWNVRCDGLVLEEGEEIPVLQYRMDLKAGDAVKFNLFSYELLEQYGPERLAVALVDSNLGWHDSFDGFMDYPITALPLAAGYYFLMIVETEGETPNLTGEYYVSEPFALDYGAPLASYSRWLGQWQVGDGEVTYHVTIAEREVNRSFTISGWEDYDDEIYASFHPQDGTLSLNSQIVEDDCDFGEDGRGQVVFSAICHNEADQNNYFLTLNNRMAFAYFTDANTATLEPELVTFFDGEVSPCMTMQFFIIFYSEPNYAYESHPIEQVPHFPMTMVRESITPHAQPRTTTAVGHPGALPAVARNPVRRTELAR